MKRLFLVLLSVILLASCAPAEEPTSQPLPQSYPPVTVNDIYCYGDSELGIFNYGALEKSSGIDISLKDYDTGESVLKILAGDKDVDIYLLTAANIKQLMDMGAYSEIDSDIVSLHNSKCFSYLRDFSAVDGKTVVMPVANSFSAVIAPKSAIAELGLTEADIAYYDGFMDVLRGYSGARKSYSTSAMLFLECEQQYDIFYNDFENKRADYSTDLYKKLYQEQLEGWVRYSQEPDSPYFLAHGKNKHSSSDTLFCIDEFSEYAESCRDFFTEWRAFPIPKLTDEVTHSVSSAMFVYINPLSENKEAATKVLESIAENYYSVLSRFSGKYQMIHADAEMYPDEYHPDSEVFNDFLNIGSNCILQQYQMLTSHSDIEAYQQEGVSLDDAIAMYQREVDMWLNE